MSYQKTQGYEALNIYASDDANIPYVKEVASGDNDGIQPDKLIGDGTKFVTDKVQVGDIVLNNRTKVTATVIKVVSETELVLNANIFSNGGGVEDFIIYAASAVNNYQNANNGCVLYVGDGGDLLVNTVGGNEKVLFSNVPIGFFPVQVTKVWKTVGAAKGAGKLVALW